MQNRSIEAIDGLSFNQRSVGGDCGRAAPALELVKELLQMVEPQLAFNSLSIDQQTVLMNRSLRLQDYGFNRWSFVHS